MITLHARLSRKKFAPSHAAEIGVYRPELSNIYEYIVGGTRATLVEPDPDSVELIRKRFAGMKNVTIYPVAVYKSPGRIEMLKRNASTYVADLDNSPAIVNDRYKPDPKDGFTVESVTFDMIDDGTIDLLSVDVEGSEWFAIDRMVSRPRVISIETHGAGYLNPYLDEIKHWMESNGYRPWHKTRTDTVFIRNGVFDIGFGDRLRLALMNARLCLRRARKRIGAGRRK